MKHPKLKEVKKHFENAKTIRIVNSNVEIEVNPELFKKNKFGVNEYASNGELLKTKNSFHCVYGKTYRKYAEILTYKEKTFSITESQIKEFYKITEIHSAQKFIENLFPEAFESEVKLEVGKWYKMTPETDNNSLIFIANIEKQECYGFKDNGDYFEQKNCLLENYSFNKRPKEYLEATEQEVFEALKNEAVKSGFKEGVFIHRPFGTDLNDHVIYKNNFPDDGDFYYNLKDNYLECYGFVVFSKGQWAEIIPTITLSEAEQQLKKKIIV